MAGGECSVAALTAVGRTARGYEDRSKHSGRQVGKVSGSVGAVKAPGLRSAVSLNALETCWSDNFDTQGRVGLGIGDRLVTTAGHYSRHDHLGADEFAPLPPVGRIRAA